MVSLFSLLSRNAAAPSHPSPQSPPLPSATLPASRPLASPGRRHRRRERRCSPSSSRASIARRNGGCCFRSCSAVSPSASSGSWRHRFCCPTRALLDAISTLPLYVTRWPWSELCRLQLRRPSPLRLGYFKRGSDCYIQKERYLILKKTGNVSVEGVRYVTYY